jgi:hypothetical protein
MPTKRDCRDYVQAVKDLLVGIEGACLEVYSCGTGSADTVSIREVCRSFVLPVVEHCTSEHELRPNGLAIPRHQPVTSKGMEMHWTL